MLPKYYFKCWFHFMCPGILSGSIAASFMSQLGDGAGLGKFLIKLTSTQHSTVLWLTLFLRTVLMFGCFLCFIVFYTAVILYVVSHLEEVFVGCERQHINTENTQIRSFWDYCDDTNTNTPSFRTVRSGRHCECMTGPRLPNASHNLAGIWIHHGQVQHNIHRNEQKANWNPPAELWLGQSRSLKAPPFWGHSDSSLARISSLPSESLLANL